MLFVRCRTRRREGFPAIKRIGRIRRPGRAPPASVPNRRASGGDSTSPRACPCRSTNRRHPPARTLHACPRTPPATVGRRLDVAACLPPAVQRIDGIRRPGHSTPARELRPQPSGVDSTSPRACPLPFNESTASAGPDAPRLPANSTRNRRTSTRHRGELPPALRCIESAARSPTRPVACQSDPQNRSSPRRHGVERRPPASRVPPTAPLARRASRAARAPARRARSGKPPPRNRAHRVDQRARDG
ncbi:hypothetical protein BBQ_4856 [Burkholderia pseudomallei MSHR511]|nr:hypothetical protein BBS_4812 [Burkholderia pseudomallei NAU20B-16]AHG36543.1 hypothetical protein BBQ_4856 [Burkholderia pseudomallei MSHR511]AHG71168.1 hypothetical protein BBN_4738 [Burkholderia pseudomallei MSHR146]KGW37237.1 hypothetical protein Y047_5457 [Burkholderia pseudomallei MSHR3016]